MMVRTKKRISVVLIDDNPSARKQVVSRLGAQPGFQVLAASAGTAVALRTVRATKPNLVLLNLRREGADSLTMAMALHGGAPESRVIIMGMGPGREDLLSFVRAGVSGFIMADASFDRFLGTIDAVAQGKQVLPLELIGALFLQLKQPTG
jgi:two-component system nitrate/nitrite response regulator NarL